MIKIAWRLFPAKKIETIRLFEATEDDSAWQLLSAMKLVDSAHEKAELFSQALEEAHHAELFRSLYASESNSKFIKMTDEKTLLYSQKKDAWKLLVYCLIGEEAAAKRFQKIAQVLPAGPMKKSLKRIIADEIGHVDKARELIEIACKSKKAVKKEIAIIKRKRFMQSWLRMGRQITGFFIDILLFIIYFLFAGLFSIPLKLTKKEKSTMGPNQLSMPKRELRGRIV